MQSKPAHVELGMLALLFSTMGLMQISKWGTGEMGSRVLVELALTPQLLLKPSQADDGMDAEMAAMLGCGAILPGADHQGCQSLMEPLSTASMVRFYPAFWCLVDENGLPPAPPLPSVQHGVFSLAVSCHVVSVHDDTWHRFCRLYGQFCIAGLPLISSFLGTPPTRTYRFAMGSPIRVVCQFHALVLLHSFRQ